MKETFISLLTIWFIAATVVSVKCQSDFRSGFIVIPSGDTLLGEIEYKKRSRNYEECTFRSNGKVQAFGPNELIGFALQDTYYAAKVVNEAFVEALVIGELSLYRHKQRFIVSKGDVIYFLESKDTIVTIDGKSVSKRDNRWKGIMSYLVSAHVPEIGKRMENMALSEKSLTRLAREYNSSSGSSYLVFKESKKWFDGDFGVAGGFSMTSVNIRQSIQSQHLSRSYRAWVPTFGAEMSISSPRLNDRLSVQTGILYTKASYAALVIIPTVSDAEYYDSFISHSTLSWPMGLAYSVTRKKISMFGVAGFNFDFNIKRSTRLLKETVYYAGNVDTHAETEAFQISGNQPGVFFGAGSSLNLSKCRVGLVTKFFSMRDFNKTKGFSAGTQRLAIYVTISTR